MKKGRLGSETALQVGMVLRGPEAPPSAAMGPPFREVSHRPPEQPGAVADRDGLGLDESFLDGHGHLLVFVIDVGHG